MILLHGLARTPRSLRALELALKAHGYQVFNIGYPSRRHPVEVLARDYVYPAIRAYEPDIEKPLHFITHSMGGILLRQMLTGGFNLKIARAVMLAPPNQGSELVDRFGRWALFRALNGPAGQQLGIAHGAPLCKALPNAEQFELGVIAGSRTYNPLLSWAFEGEHDGKVSVQSTRLSGMKAHLTLPVTHTFMMNNVEVIRQSMHFLKHGCFDSKRF